MDDTRFLEFSRCVKTFTDVNEESRRGDEGFLSEGSAPCWTLKSENGARQGQAFCQERNARAALIFQAV